MIDNWMSLLESWPSPYWVASYFQFIVSSYLWLIMSLLETWPSPLGDFILFHPIVDVLFVGFFKGFFSWQLIVLRYMPSPTLPFTPVSCFSRLAVHSSILLLKIRLPILGGYILDPFPVNYVLAINLLIYFAPRSKCMLKTMVTFSCWYFSPIQCRTLIKILGGGRGSGCTTFYK